MAFNPTPLIPFREHLAFVPIIKNFIEKLPEPVGKLLSQIPYSWRTGFGRNYRRRQKEIEQFENASFKERCDFIFKRIYNLTGFAIDKVPFYREYYSRNGFSINKLKSFGDIRRIPVITKSKLRKNGIENRSFPKRGRYIVNTGGSSGEPLSFFIQPDSIPHEWAHMHMIWKRLGYSQSKLKLVFGGRSQKDVPISYDALRHHYAINIYRGYQEVAEGLKKLLLKRKIYYLHGYPSAIYDFAVYCENLDSELRDLLRKSLKGAFLGSEFPASTYRDKIESVFGIKSISWYGHTERAILAYEKEEKFIYHPFQTYGFAEALKDSGTGKFKLIGTSFYNYASPLIRYDTGDEIEPVAEQNGILESFKIRGGREGEFVLDKRHKKIALTGLIFGRHHRIFDVARFIQIKQTVKGKATILVTINSQFPKPLNWKEWFDSDGVDIDFDFEVLKEPIKSVSGKVNLLVK